MSITCVQFSTIVLHIALALQSVTLSTHRSLGLHVKKVLVTQAHEFQYYLVGKLHLAHCKQHVHKFAEHSHCMYTNSIYIIIMYILLVLNYYTIPFLSSTDRSSLDSRPLS